MAEMTFKEICLAVIAVILIWSAYSLAIIAGSLDRIADAAEACSKHCEAMCDHVCHHDHSPEPKPVNPKPNNNPGAAGPNVGDKSP